MLGEGGAGWEDKILDKSRFPGLEGKGRFGAHLPIYEESEYGRRGTVLQKLRRLQVEFWAC